MKTAMIALALLSAGLTAAVAETDPSGKGLDLSGVTAIRITGEASSVELTTLEDEPYAASLGGRRSGWFAKWSSIWFYADCRTESRMHVEGSTLFVAVGPSSSLDVSSCATELRANVRKETSVAIEQAASQVTMAGDFGAVSLEGEAADVTLDGHVATILLKAKALRSHITFDRSQADETIEIAAHSLDAYLRFAPHTAISYGVEAAAAMVDSALPNTAGARPSVQISGQFVRATIR